MEQFGAIMDTLTSRSLPQTYEEEEKEIECSPVNVSIQSSALSAEFRNHLNGIGAGFHQERGNRDSQEDRCLLITDLSTVYTAGHRVENGSGREQRRRQRELSSPDDELDAYKVDVFKRFSMACLFDGHSGSACTEYLHQNFAQTLTAHPNILRKAPVAALQDVFRTLDRMVSSDF
jgi:hypothetical protein